MQNRLIVTPSPYLRNQKVSTAGIMWDVVIALMPTVLASTYIFGWNALKLILVSVFFAVLSEFAYCKLTHQRNSIGDLSAVVTGIILAFNIPASAPWWIPAIGAVIAIVLVKMMFGGLGSNFINPALAARTILMLSWTGLMAAQAAPAVGQIFTGAAVDAVAGATPLAAEAGTYNLAQLFLGYVPGMLGETCKLTLLIGGVYLIIRKVIDWRIPVIFIAASFVLFLAEKLFGQQTFAASAEYALYQILSGGLILGAVFMATDYVTSPITKSGKVVMGLGCALLLFVIRAFSKSYPEGCSFAILFMNILTPLIDKFTGPKSFGVVKKAGAK